VSSFPSLNAERPLVPAQRFGSRRREKKAALPRRSTAKTGAGTFLSAATRPASEILKSRRIVDPSRQLPSLHSCQNKKIKKRIGLIWFNFPEPDQA
jgi:hypothetical protein